jgi:hypothetical protein
VEALVLDYYLSFFFAMAAESRTRPLPGFSAMVLSASIRIGWFNLRPEHRIAAWDDQAPGAPTKKNFAAKGKRINESIPSFDEAPP